MLLESETGFGVDGLSHMMVVSWLESETGIGVDGWSDVNVVWTGWTAQLQSHPTCGFSHTGRDAGHRSWGGGFGAHARSQTWTQPIY